MLLEHIALILVSLFTVVCILVVLVVTLFCLCAVCFTLISLLQMLLSLLKTKCWIQSTDLASIVATPSLTLKLLRTISSFRSIFLWSIKHLSCHLGNEFFKLVNFSRPLGFFLFFKVVICDLFYLLFQLPNEIVFSLHISSKSIKFVLSLKIDISKLSQCLLLFFVLVGEGLVFLHSFLEIFLDCLELVLFVLEFG